MQTADNPDSTALEGKYCGDMGPGTLVAPAFYIRFVSDQDIQSRGFAFRFQAVKTSKYERLLPSLIHIYVYIFYFSATQ